MGNNLWKKAIAIFVLLLFIGAGILPTINGNQTDEINKFCYKINKTQDNGIYLLIYNQPFEPPGEAESPYAATSAYEEESDILFDFYVYENFWGVKDEISKIIWWGLADHWDNGFVPGTPEGMNFNIEFYDDDSEPTNAPPTSLIDTFDVKYENLKITHTGRMYTPSSGEDTELIKFEYELPSKISVSNGEGWVSIWSYDDAEMDVFLWPRSLEGDDFFYQENADDPEMDWDVAFQLFAADETSPQVSIENPINSIYIGNNELIPFILPVVIGSIDVVVNAEDTGLGMDYVEIYIDGVIQETLDSKPYTWLWDEMSFGKSVITATAYDKAGNSATSEELTVFKIF